jgi:hypothetical protein
MLAFLAFLLGMYKGSSNKPSDMPDSVGYALVLLAIGGFLIFELVKRRK